MTLSRCRSSGDRSSSFGGSSNVTGSGTEITAPQLGQLIFFPALSSATLYVLPQMSHSTIKLMTRPEKDVFRGGRLRYALPLTGDLIFNLDQLIGWYHSLRADDPKRVEKPLRFFRNRVIPRA